MHNNLIVREFKRAAQRLVAERTGHEAAGHVAEALRLGADLLQEGWAAPGDAVVARQRAHALSIVEAVRHSHDAAVVILRARL